MIADKTPTQQRLTGDDVLLSPERRGELIEGVWIDMNPAGLEHGWIETNVALELRQWNRVAKIGRVFVGEVGFYTRGDSYTVRAPDVAFISYARLPKSDSLRGFSHIPPELVVEIMLPGDSASEIEAKTHEWLDFGVDVVWVIYPKTQRLHVFSPTHPPMVIGLDGFVEGGDALPNLRLAVSAFFSD